MQELDRQDLEDILYGATILGAGGGGDIREGLEMVDTALDAGKSFRLASLHEVPDDALICTPYLLGAISELTPEEEALYAGLARSDEHPLLTAYAKFQKYLGKPFSGTTACELGGSNTAAAFFTAAMNDHYTLDADPAGRAVPEITHSTYYLAGLPASPIFATNEFGEDFVLEGVQDDMRAETLVRALCQVSRHDIAAIDHALPMSELRNALIPGTIRRSLQLGRAWRRALDSGEDVARIVADVGTGFVGYEGRITSCNYKVLEGFTMGDIELEGRGQHEGSRARISVKNENMACWIDDKVFVTIPDLICLFERSTGQILSNPDCVVGQEVSIVFLPGPDVFRTPAGLAIFGPAYAGIDAPYHWPMPS